jgi:hypothetical protein
MFKANQIGAELLAVANKSTAEIIADRVSTKIEISSTQDFKDSYEEEEKHHLQDTEGCRPILPGITRSGEITTTNSLDCYWFQADSQAEATLTVDKVIDSRDISTPRDPWQYRATSFSVLEVMFFLFFITVLEILCT